MAPLLFCKSSETGRFDVKDTYKDFFKIKGKFSSSWRNICGKGGSVGHLGIGSEA